jgi:hypothetical protein
LILPAWERCIADGQAICGDELHGMLDEGRAEVRGAGVELKKPLHKPEGERAAGRPHEVTEEAEVLGVRPVHVGGPAELSQDALSRGTCGDTQYVRAYLSAKLVQ